MYDERGHLRQQALEAWTNGTLNEDERLLTAEHLAVCDACLERMAALNAQTVLPECPAEDLVTAARKNARKRQIIPYLKRCAVVGAAACAAVVCLQYNLLERFTQPGPADVPESGILQQAALQISQELDEWNRRMTEALPYRDGIRPEDENEEC